MMFVLMFMCSCDPAKGEFCANCLPKPKSRP